MFDKQILDHGYLKLIERWGSDQSVIEGARMSTDKGFLGWGPKHQESCRSLRPPAWVDAQHGVAADTSCDCHQDVTGDEKLLAYLWKNKHCYDAETEVLTRRGFVRWSEVAAEDLLGQWDRVSDSLVYEKPLELIRRHHNGRMYRVEHGGVDLLVTENHKLLVKRIVSVPGQNHQQWATEWALVSATELDGRSMVRYRKHAARKEQAPIDLRAGERAPIFPEHNDPSSLLRLIGFFVGDGHAGGTRANGIEFHLRKARKVVFLREVCAELGWELRELAHATYSVRAEGIARFFRRQFYDESGAKIIPSYLLDLNAGDAEALLDGLQASDGSKKRGAWEYFTTSKQVADAVQLLVLHAGGAAHVACNDGYMHRVMVLSRMLEPVINQGKVNTSWVDGFDGEVFCAHTRTGVLVVRRNGKVVLSGNSTPFEMGGLTIEVQAPIFVFREWHRHRVPFGYSELSARYTPMPNLNYVPTLERCFMGGGHLTKQAGSAKGAEVLTDEAALDWLDHLEKFYDMAEEMYQYGLSIGLPKELARIVVPVGRYSRMRATGNLRGWLAFMALRAAPTAQYEIRVFANAIGEILTQEFPRTWALFAESMP